MKLHVPVTSAFPPAAVAGASISLSLLLLPGGAASVHSAGVAPALKLVAGDVIAAVKGPEHAVKRAQHPKPKPKAVLSPAVDAPVAPQRTRPHHSASRTRSAPAHRPVPRAPAPWTPATTPKLLVTTPAAPVLERGHGHGKARALGHARKREPVPVAEDKAAQNAHAHGGNGKARGRPADVPHGPPAVPPGHEKGGGQRAGDHGAPGRGGGKK
jgi:hypothetical protein